MAEKKKETIGITAKKQGDFSDWYTQVIEKAELIDIRFGIQGFLVHRPWSFFIIKKLYEYLEKEVEAQGHQQYLFPIAVKESDLKKEKEHAGFTPNVFWVTMGGDKKLEEKFALRPTGEAQIYPVYSLWLRSYKDLPFKGYQSRIPAFRNEMTTRPFIRGREFLFFETHDAFNTHEEALAQIEEDCNTCKDVIYNKMKIPFLYFKRPQWDKFKGANNTYTADTILPDGKRIQIASTHDLGQNFAKAYNITVTNKEGKSETVWQTCFGPGIWRITAALIGIHGDDKGLILPFDLAPIQIIIIPIIFQDSKDSQKIIKTCKGIEKNLKDLGYRAKFDDSDGTPGFKYNNWELKGVPIRLEIGPKEIKNDSVMVAIRTGEKKLVKTKTLEKEIKKLADNLDANIKKGADDYFKDNTREAKSLQEVIDLIKSYKGFIKAPFCTAELEGEMCANILKSKAEGADVCGTKYPKEDKVKSTAKCIVCGKKANNLVYIAKSY